ncbi:MULTISPECIES: N-acyl amino acid synthase FeeM domain-containing protein [Bacillaceae]|uniref:N-acyl amino acid synthase FeeM catalytic core domain-containing protein n=1 Tax=Evansella alkalicola TaxID=745819 RepID=A0ABS6JTP7_9BACI|nr:MULTISPECIES: hypothetical protein [Bacillaceae]MBU9721958.1 hypothetical protein [Bacillus alkalicola]
MKKSNFQYQYQFGIASNQVRKEAVALHRARYQDVGFLKDDEEDPYENDSVYFVAQEMTRNQVVGVTRLIFLPVEKLPTFTNFNIYNKDYTKLIMLEPGSYAEMSAFTKMKNHDVGVFLLASIYQYSYQHGITHWFANIDERVYRYLNRVFSEIFKEIGNRRVYMGSVSVPCVVDLENAMIQMKERRPKIHELFLKTSYREMEVLSK